MIALKRRIILRVLGGRLGLFLGRPETIGNIEIAASSLAGQPHDQEDFKPALKFKRKENFFGFLPRETDNVPYPRFVHDRSGVHHARLGPLIGNTVVFCQDKNKLNDISDHQYKGNDQENVADKGLPDGDFLTRQTDEF